MLSGMRTWLYVALVAAGIWSPRAFGTDQPWTLIDDEDGVKVYRRDVPGSGLYEFRGVGVAAATVPRIIAILADAGKMPGWVDGCVKGELVEKNFDEHQPLEQVKVDFSSQYEVFYAINSAPWPLHDRDYVIKSSLRYVPGSGATPSHINVHSENTQHPRWPEQKHLVRLPLMRIDIDLTPLDDQAPRTEIDFKVVMDPGGVVPDSVVNLITRHLPLKSVQALGKLAQGSDYNRDMERLANFYYQKNRRDGQSSRR